MMSFAPKRRMGWLPDYPDFRDYTEETEAIQDLLHPESAAKSGGAAAAATAGLLAHEAHQVDDAVGITPFVVVPGDHLEEALLAGQIVLKGGE